MPGRAKRRCRRGGFFETPNPDSTDEVDVGVRLRKLRNARALSLRALAESSGLNFNTLSLIENGKTSPSVSTLQQIAAALRVPIAAFFQPEPQRKNVVFQKAGSRPSVDFQNGGLEDLGEGLTLHGGQLMLLTMQSGAEGGPDPIIHTGQEFAFCLEGELEYAIEGRPYRMTAGDSLIFEAHLPHRWGNPGRRISRSLLILCPSDEHDRPAEQHFPEGASMLETAPFSDAENMSGG
ncbi:MAG: cupin domain-containing protein [Anaerolineales bacterium]|nr:cupin domain-containing protein [Anaerolineales bacterium]